MSEVSLQIGGRTYRVACAAGEEERVTRLGTAIGDKLASMGRLTGNDAQNLLFAALLLADEVHEGRDTVTRAESDIAAARAQAGAAIGEAEELKAALANRTAELDQLQATEHEAAQQLASAQDRLAELNERLAERQASEAALQQRVEALEAERDDRAHAANAGTAAGEDENLAPALERLAEMLEQTADKLEGAAPAS